MYYRLISVAFTAVLVDLAWAVTDPNTTDIKVSPTCPSDALGPIDSAFTGWSLEFEQLPNTVGTKEQPNVFTKNLINSVLSQTGGKAIVRLGGTSGDLSASYKPTEPTEGRAYSPSFFQHLQSLPDISYVFQVPLFPDNVKNTVEFFHAGYENIGEDRLWAVEIGNEEDGLWRKDREPDFDKYVSQYLAMEQAILATKLLKDEKKFQAIDAMNPYVGDEMEPPIVFSKGINNNSNIRSLSWHYYHTGTYNTLQSQLMNHTAIEHRMERYVQKFQRVQKNQPHILVFLGEAGLATLKPTSTFQWTLGGALWGVDYQLNAMALGVQQVAFLLLNTSGNSPFSAYEPQRVNPLYYAQQFAASFIGNKNAGTKVVALSNSTFYPCYAAYDGQSLSRLALINFKEWDSSSKQDRPKQTFDMTGLPDSVKTLHVQRLQAPSGALAQSGDITWRGTQWTVKSNGLATTVRNDTYDVTVTGGAAKIDVPDSEAAMVHT